MKITRILPKPFAKAWQEYDLRRSEAEFKYHKAMADVLEQRVEEGRFELERLERE